VRAGGTGAGVGGGVSAKGGFYTSFYSTVSGNAATSYGGGVASHGTVSINQTTIDSNRAGNGSGVDLNTNGATIHMTLTNSTISGNTASGNVAAVFSYAPLQIYNSTIAFNSANSFAAVYASNGATIVSSIIAKNTTTSGGFTDLYVVSAGTLSGSHNLIVSSNLGLADTIKSDPQLGPLSDHGGGVGVGVLRTHALNPSSPAIERGSNPLALTSDERGSTREVPAGAPDIGAYERQAPDDEIFYGGFE
jgi:hypothetical protein